MTKFSPDVVDKLLNGLANDDQFRAAFEKDPRAALSGIGHNTPAADIGVEGKDPVLPFLHLKGGLASKEKIAAGKERMANAYRTSEKVGTSGTVFGPFEICAG
jgi:putative modified peptide